MVGKKEILDVLKTTDMDLTWILDHYLDVDLIENYEFSIKFRKHIFNMGMRLSRIIGDIEYEMNRRNTNAKISREFNNAHRKVGNLFLAFLNPEKVHFFNIKRKIIKTR